MKGHGHVHPGTSVLLLQRIILAVLTHDDLPVAVPVIGACAYQFIDTDGESVSNVQPSVQRDHDSCSCSFDCARLWFSVLLMMLFVNDFFRPVLVGKK